METRSNATSACGAPFSSTVISLRVRSVTGFPARSLTSTATSTTSTPVLNRGAGGCVACAAAAGPRGAAPAATRSAESRAAVRTVVKTTRWLRDQGRRRRQFLQPAALLNSREHLLQLVHRCLPAVLIQLERFRVLNLLAAFSPVERNQPFAILLGHGDVPLLDDVEQ